MADLAEKALSLVEVGVRMEIGRPRLYTLPFKFGDAKVELPAKLFAADFGDLREWIEIVLRSAQRTALPDE